VCGVTFLTIFFSQLFPYFSLMFFFFVNQLAFLLANGFPNASAATSSQSQPKSMQIKYALLSVWHWLLCVGQANMVAS